MPLFPLVLVAHVCLALALLVPSLLLPFAIRAQRRAPSDAEPGGIVSVLLWLETRGTAILGLGVAATGFILIGLVGPAIVGQPWLIGALGIYAAVLGVAFFIQRPALAAVFGQPARPDDPTWRERAKRLRYMSYGLAAMVGAVAFLMTQKPGLW